MGNLHNKAGFGARDNEKNSGINWMVSICIGMGENMIKYLIMDVDGTLTDGKIYMDIDGESMKAFSVKDGYAINYILKPANIIPVILTARTSGIVQNRCNELGIDEVYQGKFDKLTVLKEIVGKNGLESCAYFGDDILDLKCMISIKEAGGIVACPSDAVSEVKTMADYLCVNKAGEGALREFSEWLVKPRIDENEIEGRVNEAIEYLKELNVSENNIGRQIIVNDRFFYSVQGYSTKPVGECKLESHRKYIDVQIMVKGNEFIDFADISRLTVLEKYNEDKDVVFWNIPQRLVRTTLRAGDQIVFYPENAHRGAIKLNQCEKVLKIVGKVKV